MPGFRIINYMFGLVSIQSFCWFGVVCCLVITCLVRLIFRINHPRDFLKFLNCPRFTRIITKLSKIHLGVYCHPKHVITSTNDGVGYISFWNEIQTSNPQFVLIWLSFENKDSPFFILGTCNFEQAIVSWNLNRKDIGSIYFNIRPEYIVLKIFPYFFRIHSVSVP